MTVSSKLMNDDSHCAWVGKMFQAFHHDCALLQEHRDIKITLRFPQVIVRLLCMRPLVVPCRSDINGDLAKIFSDDLSHRARISGKTEKGKPWYMRLFPIGGAIHPRKVLTLSVRGFTRLLVLQGDKHQRPFRTAIMFAKRCHCFKALASGSLLCIHCSLYLLKSRIPQMLKLD